VSESGNGDTKLLKEYEDAKAESDAYEKQLYDKYGIPYDDSMESFEKFVMSMTEEENAEWNRLSDAEIEAERKSVDVKHKKVLVIDEIQSKRHQDGREKGYMEPDVERVRKEASDSEDAARRNRDLMRNQLANKYGSWRTIEEILEKATPEEKAEWEKVYTAWDEAFNKLISLPNIGQRKGVPDAPFRKNWHELAMKRMLRLAAEEGYDKIAWTNGKMQSDRYNLSKVLDKVTKDSYDTTEDHTMFVMDFTNEGQETLIVDNATGNITRGLGEGHTLSELVGKSVAENMMALPEDKPTSVGSFEVGGEGMKGFYDQILPAFMNKYGKKWGVKVQDISLPGLQNEDGWHSVDVTPEMKESVMQGQAMFSVASKADVDKEVNDFLQPNRLNLPETLKRDNHKGAKERLAGFDIANMDDIDRSMAAIEKGLSGAYLTFYKGYELTEHPDVPEAVKDAFNDAEYKYEDIPDALKSRIEDEKEQENEDAVSELEQALSWYNANKNEMTLAPEEFFEDGRYVGSGNMQLNEESANARFSIVTDQKTIDWFDSQEKVIVYRAMTYDEATKYLGGPMSSEGLNSPGKGKVVVEKPTFGQLEQSEEHLDNAILGEGDKWAHIYIKDDAGGNTSVAYNPYIHTSLQMLNDQFAKAWRRPNMVVVKCEILKSDADTKSVQIDEDTDNRPYTADGAKNSIGSTTEWNNGPVSKRFKKKPRTVVLTQYCRPIELVSMDEYAKSVKKLLEDNEALEFGVPFSHVTPEQRDALYAAGVPISEPVGSGRNAKSMEAYNKWKGEHPTDPTGTDDDIYAMAREAKEARNMKYSREAPTTQKESIQRIRDVIEASHDEYRSNTVFRQIISKVTEKQLLDYKEKGIPVESQEFVHSIESTAIRHNDERHGVGNEKREDQIGVTESDYIRIPDILANYDNVRMSDKVTNSGKLQVIEYVKKFGDGTIMYLEEIRNGRKSLAFHNLWKSKNGTAYSGGQMYQTPTETSETTPNNSNPVIDAKDTTISDKSSNSEEKGMFSVTPAQDAEYMKAVEAGDMKKAQRMVDEVAKANGYEGLFYHGAKKGGGFTKFKDWQYFTENRAYADRYAQRDNPGSLYTVYANLGNVFDTRKPDAKRIFENAIGELGLSQLQESGLPDWTDGYDLSDYIDENGLDYDSIILDEGGDLVDGKPVSRGLTYVIRKSNQIKSAEPVTYDDNGELIPLSQRFSDSNDIRFSVFGGNSGYVGYSKSVRAVNAEKSGLRNVSQMDSNFADEVNAILSRYNADNVTLASIKNAIKNGTIKPEEWHHTSMYGNKTNYYSPDGVAEHFMTAEQIAAKEEEEERTWREEQEQLRREKELHEKYRSLYEKPVPVEFTASNGVVIRDGVAYKEGDRLTKRHGKNLRDEAFAELRETLKPDKTFEEFKLENIDDTRSDEDNNDIRFRISMPEGRKEGEGAIDYETRVYEHFNNTYNPLAPSYVVPDSMKKDEFGKMTGFTGSDLDALYDIVVEFRESEMEGAVYISGPDVIVYRVTGKEPYIRRMYASGFFHENFHAYVDVLRRDPNMGKARFDRLLENMARAAEKYLRQVRGDEKTDNFVKDIHSYYSSEDWNEEAITYAIGDATAFDRADVLKKYCSEYSNTILDDYLNKIGYGIQSKNGAAPVRDSAVADDRRGQEAGRRGETSEAGQVGESDGIRFSVSVTPTGIRAEYDNQVDGHRITEVMQDYAVPIRSLQEVIAKHTGPIRDWENAYKAENRLTSVNRYDMDEYEDVFLNPMNEAHRELVMEIISELRRRNNALSKKDARNKAIEMVDKYLVAKHGLERNKVFARRDAEKEYDAYIRLTPNGTKTVDDFYNEKRGRDYSGLTTLFNEQKVSDAEAMASAFVGSFESKYKTKELWDKINMATSRQLAISEEGGMISAATRQNIEDMFSYYIPLRGFKEDISEDMYDYMGEGTTPYSPAVKTAKGRSSIADSPIATIANMGMSTILQANRNKVKLTMLRLAENHHTPLISVSQMAYRRNDAGVWEEFLPNIPDSATDKEAEQIMRQFKANLAHLLLTEPGNYKLAGNLAGIPYKVVSPNQKRQHKVYVMRDGIKYILTVNGNPKAAQAINGQLNPETNKAALVNITNWINRNLAANFTTRNPAFVMSNLTRDAIYSNSMVWIKESPRYAANYTKNWALTSYQMIGLLHRANTHTLDLNDETDRLFDEFLRHGGETGYSNLESVEDFKGKMEKRLAAMQRAGVIRGAGDVLEVLGDGLDNFNRWAELISRFACYRTSRHAGRSISRSVDDAKEVTVNFNTKGAGTVAAGEWKKGNRLNYIAAEISQIGRGAYVFWNAGVQGMTNLGKAAMQHKLKAGAMMAFWMGVGYVIAMLMSNGDDGDDDKNKYYNLPKYVRRNNLCFRVRDTWVTIPLAIEIRAMYGMGELAYSALSGREYYSAKDLSRDIVSQMTQIMPIDMMEGGGGVNALAPSSVKPIYELIVNKDWTGMPIYKDSPYNKNEPKWQKAYSSANTKLVSLSRWLNENTGGSDHRSGWLDVNPAILEHLVEGYLGGVGTMATQTLKSVETIAGRREFEWRNTPVASRFIKGGDERTEAKNYRNAYFEYKDEIQKVVDEYNGYRRDMHDTERTDEEQDYARRKLDEIVESPEYQFYLFEWSPLYKKIQNARDTGDKELEDEATREIVEAYRSFRMSQRR
jgi:hypothetical protein